MVVPAATPQKVPVPPPIVPTAVFVLNQVPVVGVLDNVVHCPSQTDVEPEIAEGNGLTVATAFTVHPEPNEYTIVDVPADTPQKTPVAVLIVPTAVLELLHVPPPALFVNVVQELIHVLSVPPMLPGSVFTVTLFVTVHPDNV